jgi:PAS domain S-box-containing protein
LYFTKESMESFVNHTSDAIDVTDLQGNVVRVNKAFETLYGWKPEDIIGKKLPIIPDSLLGESHQMQEFVKSGRNISAVETVRRRKDGSLIDISLSLSTIRNEHGKMIAVAAISRDITERKLHEEFF